MIGQTISHYKILDKLGEGGMGVVYKAEDTKLRRSVALKFLAAEMTRDQQAKKRFINEAQAASALDHPNIAVVHEIDETNDGRSFICMAYYEGKTLKERIEAGPLTVDEALRVALQIADGLDRAHEAGIVHRDIKPANIILTGRGEVKIVDFGIAKLSGQTRTTGTSSTAGTAAYMSPEQVQGIETDGRTDLFSLGVVLYEMLTGKRPFIGEHESALLYSIVNVDPPPPSSHRTDTPPDVEKLILRLLEKDPAKRYQTAAELRHDLKQALGLTVVTPRPSAKTRPFTHRTLMFSSIVVAALLLIFISPFSDIVERWVGIKNVPAEKHIAVLPFTNVGNDSSNQAFCDGLMETLTSKLTQLQLSDRSIWVVAASEVRQRKVLSASEAKKNLGVTVAVTGSVQRKDARVRLILNVVDAKTSRQLQSYDKDVEAAKLAGLEIELVNKLVAMLELEVPFEKLQRLSGGSTLDSRAYEFYIRGRGSLARYERLENIDKAIDFFTRALKEDSSYALAYAGLGEALWRKYDATKDKQWIDPAVKNCTRAIELDNTLAPVHVTMGLIHRGSGRPEEAIKEFHQALSIDPTSSDAYRELARAYEALNDPPKAEETYKKAIALNPTYWAGHSTLGHFYYRRAQYKEAAEEFKRVIELTPDNVRGYNNLGGIYFFLEQWEDARAMFERSIKVEPNYVAYAQLGTLYFYQGNYGESARAYENALKLQGTDYRVWGYVSAAYHWSEADKAKAEASYKKAIEMAEEQRKVNPRDAGVLLDVSGYYVMLDKRKEALDLLEKALALAPTDVVSIGRASTIYEELGDRTRALTLLEKAFKNGYSPTEVEHDPAMKNLRADPKYQQLLKGGGQHR